MKIELHNNKVLLNNGSSSQEIHPFWLRERISNQEYFDNNTQQRKFDPTFLKTDISILSVKINNDLLEINFNDGAYWGEPGKFKFQVKIDSFEDATELTDRERIIRTSFSFSCRGYLVPDSINKAISTRKYITPKAITMNEVIQ